MLVVILKDFSFRDSLGPLTVLRVNVLTTDRECSVRVYLIVLWDAESVSHCIINK